MLIDHHRSIKKKTINVIRLVIFNFHAMFREYRQLNKSVMNFADRSFFSIMQTLLIKLLNETNKEILTMHQFSQGQKLLVDQNFDSFFFYKYLMFESKFFQFFTINSDEILLRNQSILNSNLNILFRNESHFITSSVVTVTESKDFAFKSFSNSNLIFSFQNKNHFNQSIRIIRSMNQKSIDQFSDHVDIFRSKLNENISSSSSSDKKNDDDEFRFFAAENASDDDEIMNSAIESDFEGSDYVEFDLNLNSSANSDMKKITLESSTIKQLKKKFMKFNQREQKEFDQNFINAKLFFFFDSHKLYIVADFKKSRILDKILRLLLIKKFEKENLMTKINSHIKYDKLFKNVIDAIKTKSSVEQIQIQNAFAIMFHFITQVFVNF